LWYDKDVREDDSGIDEALIALNGLEGERGGDLGAAAAFEEVVFALGLVVLGQVATGCATSVWERVAWLWSFVPCRITHIGGRSTFSPATISMTIRSCMELPQTSCRPQNQVILHRLELRRHFCCMRSKK
jgi:hypothetical protein